MDTSNNIIDVNELDLAKETLSLVNEYRGNIWERIEEFKNELVKINGVVMHGTDKMQDLFPLQHHLENGMYTREVFMPKGSLVVSFIHKQNHPSFFLEGEMTILLDTGEIKRIKAPMKIFTERGTQRVAYMHEDCKWVCVYRTDAKTIEEAEKEVYTEDYRQLNELIFIEKEKQCQEL